MSKYLNWEDFKKNITKESLLAFTNLDTVKDVIEDFNEEEHTNVISSYFDSMHDDVEKAIDYYFDFDHIGIVNSLFAYKDDQGNLKYAVTLILSNKDIKNDIAISPKQFFGVEEDPSKITVDPKDYLTVVVEDHTITEIDETTKILIPGYSPKISYGEFSNVDSSTGMAYMDPVTGKEIDLVPFSEKYIDTMARITAGMMHLKAVLNNPQDTSWDDIVAYIEKDQAYRKD